jgi:O-methyltransferase
MMRGAAPDVSITARGTCVDRLWPCLALEGEVWECGTYHGYSAKAFAEAIVESGTTHTLRCFDTFCGRPTATWQDEPCSGTRFEDTSRARVEARLAAFPFVRLHEGEIPATFAGLDDAQIAFAYVDLDLYAPTAAALEFILPRLVLGGVVIVDDYQTKAWPGVTRAIHARPDPGWVPINGHRVLYLHE